MKKIRVFRDKNAELYADAFRELTSKTAGIIPGGLGEVLSRSGGKLNSVTNIVKGLTALTLLGFAGKEIAEGLTRPKKQEEAFEQIVAGDPYLEENRETAYRLFQDIKKIAPRLASRPSMLSPILRQAVTMNGITPELAMSIARADEALAQPRNPWFSAIMMAKGMPMVTLPANTNASPTPPNNSENSGGKK